MCSRTSYINTIFLNLKHMLISVFFLNKCAKAKKKEVWCTSDLLFEVMNTLRVYRYFGLVDLGCIYTTTIVIQLSMTCYLIVFQMCPSAITMQIRILFVSSCVFFLFFNNLQLVFKVHYQQLKYVQLGVLIPSLYTNVFQTQLLLLLSFSVCFKGQITPAF